LLNEVLILALGQLPILVPGPRGVEEPYVPPWSSCWLAWSGFELMNVDVEKSGIIQKEVLSQRERQGLLSLPRSGGGPI